MTKSIKGTETEKNLLKSFAGESQARNRYTYFAKQAKKDGHEKIRLVFEEIANQEKQHAKSMFKHLEGGNLEITAMYPAGMIGTTEENLQASVDGEHEEQAEIYPEFARIAEEEGFQEIATMYRMIANAETHHEARFKTLLDEVKAGSSFKKEEKTRWACLNCGFVYEGTEAPKMCPACQHPTSWFEALK
ncbi:rubrerythrin family protein [bacterium]|nr:rubrerythrin family protein [bacterium]